MFLPPVHETRQTAHYFDMQEYNNLYGTNCDYINDGVNSAGKFWSFIDQYKDFSSESEISEEGFKVDG